MWSRRLAWLGTVLVCRGLRRLGTSVARGLLRFMVGRRVGHGLLAVARSRRCSRGRKFPGAGRAPFTGWPRALVCSGELRTRRLGGGVALALTVVAIDVALADTLSGAFAAT